ncbi:hypothetical protein [Asticcacaulis sp.]|uniref:hypothetical protein n=1 Tax=Asticcacaulis sp. TaxID=1872648 RepID=UPI002BD15D43|nr:hypothetical protein [Asticcacaulis sp.]HTM79486.1 hypothetical protein [Asticcacaulis sp.]
MKLTPLKLTCAAILAATLTGCIMYVAPDHGYDPSPPASAPVGANEKPAATLPDGASF